jgi:hypothetical protein
MWIIGIFIFITLGFAWSLSDKDIKEIKNRLNIDPL